MPLIRQLQEEGLNTIKKQIDLNGLIEFKDVTFSYPGSENIVLDKVSFTLYPNQFNVLFGPSGCGKSTVILIILGFYPIKSGSIFIDGHDLSEPISNTLDHKWERYCKQLYYRFLPLEML